MAADEPAATLVSFSCAECYVYAPLPPASSYGHRADLWDVEKWLKAVRLRVVTCGDDAAVELEDPESGELFAECPLPNDGTSLTTAVEPVVDSSRYFVIRVVDRAAPRKHAFVGLGFRSRGEASDFTAALDDYRQYLRRKAAAEAMRAEYAQSAQSGSGEDLDSSSGSKTGGGAGAGLSLKPGQTISIKLNQSIKRQENEGQGQAGSSSASSLSSKVASRLIGAAGTQQGGLLPPPPAAVPLLRPPPAAAAAHPEAAGDAAAQAAASLRQLRVTGSITDRPATEGTAGPAGQGALPAEPDTNNNDDWARFDD